jgi:pyrroline-5-carboxylate reductase
VPSRTEPQRRPGTGRTKGGITEEGAKVIKSGLPQVFDEMFEQTLAKRKMVSEKTHNNFGDIS